MKKNKRNTNYFSIIIIIISTLAVVFLIFSKFYFKTDTLDSELCPKSAITSVTAILIDGTDNISDPTKIDILNQINELISSTFIGGKIDVYIVDGNNFLNPNSISLCKPPDGSADVDGITSNPKQLKFIFENKFYIPLKQKIEELLNTQPTHTSPIIESIQAISLKTFVKYKNIQKKLIIISDGLQHTDQLSFYKSIPKWQNIKASFIGSTLNCDLTNVNVELLIIQRQSNINNLGKIRQFFSDYCSDMGGELTKRYLLSGAN